jgi:hypothetical protein
VLPCVHSPVQQPLYGTFRDRRRNQLVLAPRRGVIDDDIGLSTNICLEIAQQTRHLAGGHSGQFVAVGDNIERDQRFANEIEGPSDLAVPQAPAKPIDDLNEIRTRLAIVRGDVRPTFGRLINMENPHRKVEPVKYMMSRARTGRFAERTQTFRPITEDRDRGDGRRARFMKDTAQLVLVRNSLRGHAAENDLLPVVICDLSEQNLQPAYLILTNRSDVAAIDGKHDRFRRHRGWFHHLHGRDGLLLQPRANTDRASAGRLHRRNVVERQKRRQPCSGAPVWQRSSHLRDNPLIIRRASVRHDLTDRAQGPVAGHRATAWFEPRRGNTHGTEQ